MRAAQHQGKKEKEGWKNERRKEIKQNKKSGLLRLSISGHGSS